MQLFIACKLDKIWQLGEVKSTGCRMRGLEKNIHQACRTFDLHTWLARTFFLTINHYMHLTKSNCM